MRNAMYEKCNLCEMHIWKCARERFHAVKLLLRHLENVSTRLIIVVRWQFVTGRCYFLVIFISFEKKFQCTVRTVSKQRRAKQQQQRQTNHNEANKVWYKKNIIGVTFSDCTNILRFECKFTRREFSQQDFYVELLLPGQDYFRWQIHVCHLEKGR